MRKRGWPVLAALAAAAVLLWLSVAVTRHALNVAAADEAAQYAAGNTPWHWRLRAPGDVIAGRAFGHARLGTRNDTLTATSVDGTSYAIGLPMARPVDLLRFPRLHLEVASTHGFRLRLALRQDLLTDLLVSSEVPVGGDAQALDLNLAALTWRNADGAIVVPTRAAMLRLRNQQAAGNSLSLHGAQLLPAPSTHMAIATQPDTAAAQMPTQLQGMLDRLAHHTPRHTVPVVLVGNRQTAASMLNQRDRIRAQMPAAIVAAGAHWRDITVRPGSPPRWIAWFGLLVYAALLLGLLLRPPRHPRWRATLEISACCAPPLAWAIGLRAASAVPMVWSTGVVLALIFTCLLAWRQRWQAWRWIDKDWRTWALPAAAVVAAIAFLLACHAAPRMPSAHRMLTYLLWALLQQLMMLVVITPRLQQLAYSRAWVIIGTALLFALMHAPNGWLMQLTFMAELWWAWCFLRRPTLLPIAVAHAVAALLLTGALGALPLRSLEVGALFLR